MKKILMAAVALICMTCESLLLTSCTAYDVPVVLEEPTALYFVESDFSAGNGIALGNNMIYYGEYSLVFKTNKPTELDESDFSVIVDTDGATVTPGLPLDIDISEVDIPQIVIKEPYHNPDDQWVVNMSVFLPYMVLGQQINLLLSYKGETVGDTLKVNYERPYSFEFEGSEDGYLYPGQTYPIKVHTVSASDPTVITKDDILAVGNYGMTPAHNDEFEVDINDETGSPYMKILDTFTFAEAELKAGYALICPNIVLSDGSEPFQVVPVKVPTVEID